MRDDRLSDAEIDRLISGADPIATTSRDVVDIPSPHSADARELFEEIVSGKGARRETRSPRLASPRLASLRVGIPLGLAACIAVVVSLIAVGAVPSPFGTATPAGASELDRIADRASQQPAVTLGPGQYLYQKMTASFAVSVGSPNGGAQPAATATIPATLETWGNGSGTVYYRDDFGTAHFATPADEAGWQAAGLQATPTQSQPEAGHTVGSPYAPGFGVLDVSKLPTDPKVLGGLLGSGRTGIVSVDALPPGTTEGSDAAVFQRAVLLLLGPDVGGSPAFNAAVYRVLASLSGVKTLGPTTDATGRIGDAFSVATPSGTEEIVVKPDTGMLLEVRNMAISMFFSDLRFSVVNHYVPGVSSRVPMTGTAKVGNVTLSWLDLLTSVHPVANLFSSS